MPKRLFYPGLILIVIVMLGSVSCTPRADNTTTTTTAAATEDMITTTTVEDIATATAEQKIIAAPAELPGIAGVVAKVRPSVVAINVRVTTFGLFNNPVPQQGAGTGWVIRSDGYIVTNQHVIENAENIVVITADGSRYEARDVFSDAFTDLAVLKIDAAGLAPLAIGDVNSLNVGDWVIAIGNALGQGISATAGIVSARDVSLDETGGETLNNLIQTDTAINPGNSGGPLVNLAGEVIGITSLKISQVGVEGMGYAISINQALPVIETLITEGRVIRPWLGISALTVDAQVAAYYNLSVDTGVLITRVAPGSPADTADLQPGDVVTALNGEPQTNSGDLINYVNSLRVDDEINVTYQRGKNSNTVTVTLAPRPS